MKKPEISMRACFSFYYDILHNRVIQLDVFLMISDSSTCLPVNFMFALCD